MTIPRPSLSLSLSVILAGVPVGATAQTPPLPGVAEGTVDGAPFSVPLDCAGWQNEVQRTTPSAGDGRSDSDENGDGYLFNFNYLVPADRGDGTLIVEGRELLLNAGIRPGPDAPSWEVDDDTARFSGPTFGQDVAQVDVTVDCAPRAASARGFTGSVTGVIDGTRVDEALFCGGWDTSDTIEARTEDTATTYVEIFVVRPSGQGEIVVETAEQSYEIVAAQIARTGFKMTEDRVAFSDQLTSFQTGETYTVDLTFECMER